MKCDRKLRILAIAPHVVQYASPLYRLLAQHEEVEFHVAYCSLRGAEAGHDPEFAAVIQWDIPLLDGYAWTFFPNKGSGTESFFGLTNPGLWKFIRRGKYDAILCYTGYLRVSFWISYLAAKTSGTSFLFGTDATALAPRDQREWKVKLKKIVWPLLFNMADQIIIPSSASRQLMSSLGVASSRITLTPYAVDNDWWSHKSSLVDRDAVRQSWGATPNDPVILFCAKLQPWKRPLDILRAFSRVNLPGAILVFAGDGPLRPQLESEAHALGIDSRVRFLGFLNQSELAPVYTSADVMVLPSEYEPFAVVVNEAMCCGCAVIASDAVGAAPDLIAPVHPEFIYPCKDVGALAKILQVSLADLTRLRAIGRNFRDHMQSWSPEENVAKTLEAVKITVARKPNHQTEPQKAPSSS